MLPEHNISVTKKQKDILPAFGMNSEYVNEKAAEIGTLLKNGMSMTDIEKRRMATMAGKKSITAIDAEIKKVKIEMVKAKEKYEKLSSRFLTLQEEHKKYEAEQILDAYAMSGKSYNELMTFLGA